MYGIIGMLFDVRYGVKNYIKMVGIDRSVSRYSDETSEYIISAIYCRTSIQYYNLHIINCSDLGTVVGGISVTSWINSKYSLGT